MAKIVLVTACINSPVIFSAATQHSKRSESPAGSGEFKETYRAADNQAESHSDEDVDSCHAGESPNNGDVCGPGFYSFCCLVHVEGLEKVLLNMKILSSCCS